MKTIEVTQDFAFAEQGIYVTEYTEGQVVPVSDECADLAIKEKWAKISKRVPAEKAAEQAEAERIAAEQAEAERIAAEQK